MSTRDRLRQSWAIASLQLRRVFFARRSLWVYVLALFPTLPFAGHGIDVVIKRNSWNVTDTALLESVQAGESVEQVLTRLGEPASHNTFQMPPTRDGQAPPRAPVRHVLGRQQALGLIVRGRRPREAGDEHHHRFRRRPDGLRCRLPVLLPAARDLLRLPGHLHEPFPRRDARQERSTSGFSSRRAARCCCSASTWPA